MATLSKHTNERQYDTALSSGARRGAAKCDENDLLKTQPSPKDRTERHVEPMRPRSEPESSSLGWDAAGTSRPMSSSLRARAQGQAPQRKGDESTVYATDDLFRRVGYYDLRAYTQLVDNGLSQGFILVRHHTLVNTIQSVFRAGSPQPRSATALSMAVEQLDRLALMASTQGIPMDQGELLK